MVIILKTQKVLITGTGSGLGKCAALELARRGHKVFATVQFENQVEKLKNEAKKNNLDLTVFKLDIRSKKDRESILNYDFDIIINNAGIGDSGSVSEINIDRFKDVFETNVFSAIEITQIALKKFIENKYGKVIFISSLFGKVSSPFLSPYCSSKFAIEALAYSLRKEMKTLDGVNIQVAIIEPGAYATGFNQKNISKKFDWMQKKSYFKYKLEDIKLKEEKFFKFTEKKRFTSIINKYIKVVEAKNLKKRYSAPMLQSILVKFAQIFGV